jgi:hypothetical protein
MRWCNRVLVSLAYANSVFFKVCVLLSLPRPIGRQKKTPLRISCYVITLVMGERQREAQHRSLASSNAPACMCAGNLYVQVTSNSYLLTLHGLIDCDSEFTLRARNPPLNEHFNKLQKLNSMAWVRERTVPPKRQPLVGEVSVNFCA